MAAGAGEQNAIDYILTISTDITYSEVRKLEMSLMRIMTLVERFSGSPELNKMLSYIQKSITALRQVQMAIRAVQAAEGPIGWLYAAVSVIGAATTVSTDMYDATRGNQ